MTSTFREAKENTLKELKSSTIKPYKNNEEGPRNLSKINSGRTVAAATTGDYLGNLDIWVIIVFE